MGVLLQFEKTRTVRCFDHPQLASGLNDPPRSGALRWGEKAGEGAPPGAPAHRRLPDAQDDHLETSSTSTCCSLHYFQSCKEFIDAARAHVGESCSMPSSAVGSVGNDKGAVYCFLFIPPSVAWAAGLSRWGYPPLNPGRPPERAGESTRTPLISPEKLALPRPRGGLRLPHLSPDSFERPGGSGDHTRAPAPARQSGPLPLHMAFLPPRRVNLDLT